MGRPPKPLEVHRRNGNPSRKKLPARSETITLAPATDAVPISLGPRGREVYRRSLDLAVWISELDLVALEDFARTWDEVYEMRDVIAGRWADPPRAHRYPGRQCRRRETSRPPATQGVTQCPEAARHAPQSPRLRPQPPEPSSVSPRSRGKAGSKSSSRAGKPRSWPPLHLTPVPAADIKRGDGERICEAIETLCTVSKDGFAAQAGDPIVLRDWQKTLLGHLFARRPDGRLRHRVALVGLPRKNGKSSLGSALALDGLIFGGNGAEVYSAAAEKEQARIVFGETKRMIAADPELAALCHPMRDVIEVPATNSILRCLSAEAYSKEGLNISRAIVDELHAHPTRDLWDVLTMASAARIDPLVIAITTAGVRTQSDGQDTVCYELYRHGLEVAAGTVEDPSFFLAWWGAPQDADYRDPAVWQMANPGYGDLVDPEDFESHHPPHSRERVPDEATQSVRLLDPSVASGWRLGGVRRRLEDDP